jgi:hypothetical protein
MKIRDVEIFDDQVLRLLNQQGFVALRLSGGIDSAILLHCVLQYLPYLPVVPFTFFNKLRPSAVGSVAKVLACIKDLNPGSLLLPHLTATFDTTGGYVRTNDMPNGTKGHPKDILAKQFVRSLFDAHPGVLNVVLSGETMNPPIQVQHDLGMADDFLRYRNDPSDPLLVYKHTDKSFKYEYRPFAAYTKKQVAEVCAELGLLETLFPLTETCESVMHQYTDVYPERFGITYTKPGEEPCQCCWPCREKYWAYGVFDFNTPLRATLP